MATKKRVTAKKHMGDDLYSWAVFFDGYPVVTGLSKREVPYYKRQVRQLKGLTETDCSVKSQVGKG